jgi:hypothetical protein
MRKHFVARSEHSPFNYKTKYLAMYWDVFIGFTHTQYTLHGKNVQFLDVTYVCEEAKAHQGL